MEQNASTNQGATPATDIPATPATPGATVPKGPTPPVQAIEIPENLEDCTPEQFAELSKVAQNHQKWSHKLHTKGEELNRRAAELERQESLLYDQLVAGTYASLPAIPDTQPQAEQAPQFADPDMAALAQVLQQQNAQQTSLLGAIVQQAQQQQAAAEARQAQEMFPNLYPETKTAAGVFARAGATPQQAMAAAAELQKSILQRFQQQNGSQQQTIAEQMAAAQGLTPAQPQLPSQVPPMINTATSATQPLLSAMSMAPPQPQDEIIMGTPAGDAHAMTVLNQIRAQRGAAPVGHY
jgi:hypothetical protein